MIVVKNCTRRVSLPAWHKPFLAMVPTIVRYARKAFREASAEIREDLIQEAVANCLVAYVRLVERGKAECGVSDSTGRLCCQADSRWSSYWQEDQHW